MTVEAVDDGFQQAFVCKRTDDVETKTRESLSAELEGYRHSYRQNVIRSPTKLKIYQDAARLSTT